MTISEAFAPRRNEIKAIMQQLLFHRLHHAAVGLLRDESALAQTYLRVPMHRLAPAARGEMDQMHAAYVGNVQSLVESCLESFKGRSETSAGHYMGDQSLFDKSAEEIAHKICQCDPEDDRKQLMRLLKAVTGAARDSDWSDTAGGA